RMCWPGLSGRLWHDSPSEDIPYDPGHDRMMSEEMIYAHGYANKACEVCEGPSGTSLGLTGTAAHQCRAPAGGERCRSSGTGANGGTARGRAEDRLNRTLVEGAVPFTIWSRQ